VAAARVTLRSEVAHSPTGCSFLVVEAQEWVGPSLLRTVRTLKVVKAVRLITVAARVLISTSSENRPTPWVAVPAVSPKTDGMIGRRRGRLPLSTGGQ
jgi:hypothetical protein